MCETLGGRSSETQGCRYFALAHSTPVHSPGSPFSLRLWLSEEPEAGKRKWRHGAPPGLTGTSTSNVLLFSRSVVSDSLGPHGLEHQASLSFIISQSLCKLLSIESVIPSNHLIFCHPLLLPSIFHSNRMAKVLEFQLQHQSFQ